MPLTTIPDDFGTGGTGLVPNGSRQPALVDILQEHKAAIEAAQTVGATFLTKTVTVGHADLTEAVNNTAQVVNIGTALPANAFVVGAKSKLDTAFSGGAASAVTVDVGGTDADAIIDGRDLFTGASTVAGDTPKGVKPTGLFSAEQLTATFLTDAGHALLGLTAGSVTITVYYFVAALDR